MRRRRFTEEQIIGILKEADAGAKIGELCRRHGIAETTFYRWRKRYGDLEVNQAKIALGHSNREVAQHLHFTPSTVGNHLHAAFGKVGRIIEIGGGLATLDMRRLS